MTQATRYFTFAIAQYVHSRREERLNVGVIVYDPDRRVLSPVFDSGAATKRIKQFFPEVDRANLQIYLQDLERGLADDPQIRTAIEAGKPFEPFAGFDNIIQFTGPRVFPAATLAVALQRLREIYVNDPARDPATGGLRGVSLARQLTREAINKVLNPIEGLGVHDLVIPRRVEGGPLPVPLKFPFLVLDHYAIDTLSFDTDGTERPQMQADHFIQKVIELRELRPDIQPHATAAMNQAQPERGHTLLAYIRERTGLPEWAVASAEDAECVVTEIKRLSDAA